MWHSVKCLFNIIFSTFIISNHKVGASIDFKFSHIEMSTKLFHLHMRTQTKSNCWNVCEKIRKTHLCPGIEFVRLNIRLLIRIKTFDKTIISRYVFLTLYDNIYQSQVRDVSRNRIRNWAKKLHPKGKNKKVIMIIIGKHQEWIKNSINFFKAEVFV